MFIPAWVFIVGGCGLVCFVGLLIWGRYNWETFVDHEASDWSKRESK